MVSSGICTLKSFCEAQGLEKKAILLLDNAPSHPSSETLQSDDGMIKTIFLPLNTTASIQPLDQGVLDPSKRRYKKKLLSHVILESKSEDKSVPEVLKGINMKHVVYWISSSWDEASPDSLRKSWKKLLPECSSDSDPDTQDDDSSSQLVNAEVTEIASQLGQDIENDITHWMEADVGDPGHQIMDDDEIVADMVGDGNEQHEDSSDEEIGNESSVSASQAFQALEVTLRWLEQQKADPNHLLMVTKWRDEASRIRSQSLRQTSLLSFCSAPKT